MSSKYIGLAGPCLIYFIPGPYLMNPISCDYFQRPV